MAFHLSRVNIPNPNKEAELQEKNELLKIASQIEELLNVKWDGVTAKQRVFNESKAMIDHFYEALAELNAYEISDTVVSEVDEELEKEIADLLNRFIDGYTNPNFMKGLQPIEW